MLADSGQGLERARGKAVGWDGLVEDLLSPMIDLLLCLVISRHCSLR
jgi:hypothetical protein